MAGIRIPIGANTEDFDKKVREVKQQVANLGGELRTGISTFAKYGAAATAAGVAVGAALVNSSIQASRELENLARLANTSRTTFQGMAVGARTVGIEQDKLADILKDVNDRVGDFLNTGGGPMADFFERIAPKVGVTAQQFRNLSGPQALQLYVDSLEKANLSQSEMTFFMEAMASDATMLLPLLRDGGQAMAEQAEQAERLGLVLSEVDSEQMLQAQRAMQEIGEVANSFIDQLSADLAPVIIAISKLLREQAEEVGGVGEAASDAFGFIVDSAEFVINAVDGIKRVFQVAADVIIAYWSTAAGFIADKIEFLAELADSVPGVDMSDSLESIREFGRQSDTIANEAWNNINETLTRPMAGDQFREFEREARESAERTAMEAIKIRENLEKQTGGGTQTEVMTPEEEEALKKKLQKRLDIVREFQKKEREGIVSDVSIDLTNKGDQQTEELRKRLQQLQAANEQPMEVEMGVNLQGQEELQGQDTGNKLLRERMANRLAILEEARIAERDAKLEEFEQNRADLQAALAMNNATEAEANEALKAQKRKQEQELTAIDQAASAKREAIAKAEAEFKKKALGDALSSLSTLMNSESRKQFEIGKAASLAQAVIDGYAAITGAYKVGASIGGPVLGAAYAGAAGLATFQQIQAIKNTQFQGGGSGGGAATGGGTGAISNTQQVNAQTEEVRRTTSVDIALIGGDSRDRAVAGSVIEQINDEIERGGRISRVGLA